jgi:hypothetical protein
MTLSFTARMLRSRMIDRSRAAKIGSHYGALMQGADAFRHGYSPCACPHILDSDEWHNWYAGWLSLFDRLHWSL